MKFSEVLRSADPEVLILNIVTILMRSPEDKLGRRGSIWGFSTLFRVTQGDKSLLTQARDPVHSTVPRAHVARRGPRKREPENRGQPRTRQQIDPALVPASLSSEATSVEFGATLERRNLRLETAGCQRVEKGKGGGGGRRRP